MYNLLPAVLALASLVSAQITSPGPPNPPITYDALTRTSSEERYNVTIYYTTTTVFGISTSINVNDVITIPDSAPNAPCPTNFFTPTSATANECVYCPSTGFYSTTHNYCASEVYLLGGCASGYFLAGTRTSGGTYLESGGTATQCLPSTVPVPKVPECNYGWVTVGDFCVLPSIQPSVRIDSYTTTTVTQVDGSTATFTYDDYTYVYASGVNTSDVGGSFTSTPFGFYTGPVTTITTYGQTYTEAVGVPASIYLQGASSGTAVVAAPGQTSSGTASPATTSQGASSASSSLPSASAAGAGSSASSNAASSVSSLPSGSSGSILVTVTSPASVSGSSAASSAGGVASGGSTSDSGSDSAETEVVTSVSTVVSGSASGSKVTVVVAQTTKGQGSGSGSGTPAASGASGAASSVPAFQGAAAGVQMVGGLGMLVVLAVGVLGVVIVL